MQPYQERVVAEKQELDTKLKALGEFIDSGRVRGTRIHERNLLLDQRRIMQEYSNVLAERIAYFQHREEEVQH